MPGLLVDSVSAGGLAEKVGIRKHDVMYKYNIALLNSVDDLIAATRSTKVENKLTVIRCRDLLEMMIPGGSLGVSVLPYPQPDIMIEGVGEVLAKFRNEDEATTQAQTKAQHDERLAQIASIQLTTAPQLEGFRVSKTLSIITAEYVGGMNLFRDFLAEVTDLVGGRSGSMQNELKNARETCLTNLKIEAYQLGANAVIGVDLDYSEISGGGKSMLFLVASGTAVIVE